MNEHSPLKILFVSSEVSPYVKSGGLGDVIGTLPKELVDCGVDARIVFPKYRTIQDCYLENKSYLGSFTLSLGWRNQSASVYQLDVPVKTYIIENDYYFNRDGLYGYGDDYERFSFFSKASIEFLNTIDFLPDVIQFNDWQTAIGCVYLKDTFGGFVSLSKIKSLFTIHNIQYQGVFGRGILDTLDLNDGYFTGGQLEFYNNISLLKSGIVYADAVSTVSETYAKEIQTPAFGYSMDGVLRSVSHKLYGILNGIDYSIYDPATNPMIFENFTKDTLEKKKTNKKRLQELLGLPQSDVPMIGIISRLVDQKGLDLVSVAMEEIINMDIQLVVLGTGDGRYEQLFRNAAWRAPDKISANIFFSDELAQRIYAAADILLMPSLFEPCGLGQMFAMRYGTVPVVRNTGGLADSVTHYDLEEKTGNGFVFNDFLADGMMWALRNALEVYEDPNEWNIIVRNAMDSDFSWQKSAEKYIELYTKLRDSE